LITPVRGQVNPGTSVLDLVERLHPTPAMGGYPKRRALQLIRACEGLDRGWYAAPIGWLNREGEGEFVVGIRSALLRGRMATLFAGCGIVGESDAAAEYAESEWKLRPMLAALGVEA
jgi:menaquinone-specific isochorismate synthase